MKKCAIFCYFDESVNDRQTDGWTDGWTDGRTDRPSYRDARSHLKIILAVKLFFVGLICLAFVALLEHTNTFSARDFSLFVH